MEIQTLKKFEGKECRLILKNNFVYSYVIFKITDNGLVEFSDKHGEALTIEPSFISGISKIYEEENAN